MRQPDRVERSDHAAPDEEQRRHDVPVGGEVRHQEGADEADDRAAEQQMAAVADAVADHADRDLQHDVAEADHREQQRCVRFRIADARAIDRKQREAAGLDRAEDQHRGGGGRHKPDEAEEAGRFFLALRVDRRAFAPGGQHGNRRDRDQAEGHAERQESPGCRAARRATDPRRSRATARWRRCRARSRAGAAAPRC